MTERRNRWGHYLITPPEGGKPKGYIRATTVAKTLDDQGSLIAWKAAMALTGVMRRPGLRAQLEAAIAEHPTTGPWYGGIEAKRAMKALVEDAAQAGGSSDRAEIGTALHAICEAYDLGQTPVVSQTETAADLAAYSKWITDNQITFSAEHIESIVVLDEYQVAGKADRLVAHIPGHQAPMVADLKTGGSLDYGQQAIAVQLAIYAHADAVYHQGEAADGSQDVRAPMPEVDQERALVIHLPAGEARCHAYYVDIAAGWEAFQRSMWTRGWRRNKNLFAGFAAPTLKASPAADDGFAATPPPSQPPRIEPTATVTPIVKPDEGGAVDRALIVELQGQMAGLDPEAQALIAATVAESTRAKVTLHSAPASGGPTMRKYDALRGLILCLRQGFDTDTIRALLGHVTGSDEPLFPATPLGAALGSLDAAQAARFADLVLADGWAEVAGDDGVTRVVAA